MPTETGVLKSNSFKVKDIRLFQRWMNQFWWTNYGEICPAADNDGTDNIASIAAFDEYPTTLPSLDQDGGAQPINPHLFAKEIARHLADPEQIVFLLATSNRGLDYARTAWRIIYYDGTWTHGSINSDDPREEIKNFCSQQDMRARVAYLEARLSTAADVLLNYRDGGSDKVIKEANEIIEEFKNK